MWINYPALAGDEGGAEMSRARITGGAYAVGFIALSVLLCGSIGKAATTLTGSIKGCVVDSSTGEGLPSAAVIIAGTTMGVMTSSDGSFTIKNIPPGKYSILFRLAGYCTAQVDDVYVVADSTTEVNAALERTVIETDIILTCTAKRDVMEMSKPTSGVTISKPVEVQHRYGELRIRGGRSGDVSYVTDGAETLSGLGPTDAAVSTSHDINRCGSPPMAHGGNTPPNAEAYDAMFFKHYGVNPFVSAEDDNLSTFAVDIDDASFIMARTYLQRGNLPPEEVIRVEEFVNHFDYGYDAPEREPFNIFIEGSPSPFGKGYNLLRIGIKGRVIPPDDRKPAVLTFVVDVSGSMAREDRLGAVRHALRMLVDQLRGDDLVGIVVYGSCAQIVLEHTSVAEKEKIIHSIESLQPSGATNAEAGLVLGYDLAEEHFREGATNRIILCSDGVANVGRTGADDILKRIERQVKKGITLSSIGFGLGNYNDVLLEKLGNKGNGYYAYVNNLKDAEKIFVDNLTGSLEVIARDVKIQVVFDTAKVDRYRLLGFENRDVEDDKFRDDTVDGGEVGSGHSCTALYEIKLKENASGSIGTFQMRFKDPDTDEVTELAEKIDASDFRGSFSSCESEFKLAAVAAEFAEIMRGSYWARGSSYELLLEIAQGISGGIKNSSSVIEFIDLVSKASDL